MDADKSEQDFKRFGRLHLARNLFFCSFLKSSSSLFLFSSSSGERIFLSYFSALGQYFWRVLFSFQVAYSPLFPHKSQTEHVNRTFFSFLLAEAVCKAKFVKRDLRH